MTEELQMLAENIVWVFYRKECCAVGVRHIECLNIPEMIQKYF